MADTSRSLAPFPAKFPGPSLMLLALIYTALVIVGVIVGVLLSPHAAFPLPFQPTEKAVAYVGAFSTAIRWGAFLQLASAMPLGIFAATAISRLRFLGVRAAGESIALFGGVAAMATLIISALADWALSAPNIADTPGAVRALQLLGFAAGGPGFVAPLGLLVAGVSVTAGLRRLIPRWIVVLGLVIAISCELATLTLITWNAAIFIPIGRFITMVWMIAIAAKLPTGSPEEIRST